MELRQLQYVIQVATERSFSRAAEKLHLAQPSLSQQIAKVEHELGVVLFQRSTNYVELTQAGQLFVERSQAILNLVEQLHQEMDDISQMKKGRLIVGSMPMTGATILPRVIPKFQAMYPDIEISLIEETSSQLEMITSQGQTDISILSLPLQEESLHYEQLYQEEIVLAVPPGHPLATHKEEIQISLLAEESFIFLKRGLGFHQQSVDICQAAGVVPRIVFESSNMETIQSLVAAGMGIAFVPSLLADRTDHAHAPIYLKIAASPSRTLVIAYKKGRYISKAAEAFIHTMKAEMNAVKMNSSRITS